MIKLIGPLKYPKIDLKNIKTETLGWVRPDNTINFQTIEAAQTYAKNRVIQALKQPLPCERGIIVNKNRILKEFNGNSSKIELQQNLPNTLTESADFIHGHPNFSENGTTPVSLHDYLSLIANKFNRMVAYNQNGEYSILEKQPESKFMHYLPKKLRAIIDLCSRIGISSIAIEKYSNMWKQLFPAQLQKNIPPLINANINNEIITNRKLLAEGKKLLNDSNLINEVVTIETELLQNGQAAKAIDKFWQEQAKHLGVNYSTNFQNLK